MARILLVDDDAAVLELSAEVLSAAGHHIACAVDGAEALMLLQGGKDFEALITDNAMPGMPGRTLIAEARILHPALRCLLTTGYGDVAAEDGNFSVLRKPFRAAGLVAAVAVLLGGNQ